MNRSTVIALGFFDGVHRGHGALLEKTAARARELGSDYIVVGRPITQADDPVAAYRQCVREFVG